MNGTPKIPTRTEIKPRQALNDWQRAARHRAIFTPLTLECLASRFNGTTFKALNNNEEQESRKNTSRLVPYVVLATCRRTSLLALLFFFPSACSAPPREISLVFKTIPVDWAALTSRRR